MHYSVCYRFENKLLPIMEHFHDVMRMINSRLRAESFKVIITITVIGGFTITITVIEGFHYS